MHKNVGKVFQAGKERNYGIYAAGTHGFILLSDLDGFRGDHYEYGTLGVVGPETFDSMYQCYVYP